MVSRPAKPRAPPNDAENIPIVGIGASAGGLDAATKLVDALRADSGMAFILVQHLDPNHQSMMVDLLAGHTAMPVRQATDGMPIERNHIYVIPPGTYLAVAKGMLSVSEPLARHGARLPFDFLLHSLAEACGARAACVVLSGTGADGSIGLRAIRERNGLVIAQDPREAQFGGMPRSAIMTGAVDLVLPLADMPAALARHQRGAAAAPAADAASATDGASASLGAIIELLRASTAHDFTPYKPGTLERRIERRMAMANVESSDMDRYLEMLRGDPRECELLSNDLLINVTSFFRDPKVFAALAAKIVPDMVRGKAPSEPLRVWIAGCSTGEETYSFAMLIREAMTEAKLNNKLQIFASDIDSEAIATAREGLYPDTIEAEVSAERLTRFFSREDRGYRVLPELRAAVVFTVQDVLADPPFSRIDLVSCRNLLIYLRPEAQAKVVALFHFALGEGGILVLGTSETIGTADGRFEVISKPNRLYRHISRGRPGELGFAMSSGGGLRVIARDGHAPAPSQQTALADLSRRIVLDNYAPAAVLINRAHECLYSMGPTDRYLRVAPGQATHDLLAMARPDIRNKLRAAIQQATKDDKRTVVTAGAGNRGATGTPFNIVIRPLRHDGEPLLLICFIDAPGADGRTRLPVAPPDLPRVAALELELEATKQELEAAIRNLEISGDEQRAINEEALSVAEEYQSTNEELLTSKEELQSLNEELTALNSQLHETLDRQRTTADDLQNVLYSTDIATLFLDANLDIRFYTPATRSLFSVIPSDIGRPLADLHALVADTDLLSDARKILGSSVPIEREIRSPEGAWFLRRVLPYRTHDNRVEGVVITFSNITERKLAASAMEASRHEAENASLAKSRFLAAASHDLRQPLQTLSLLQGLLSRKVETEAAKKLVTLMEPTLDAMSGMLNMLLDINQIDSGTVHPEPVNFPINDMLGRLRDEFDYHAKARSLDLRVVECGLMVRTDRGLLEQIIRNLLSNALKYTLKGKVLLGCRRRADVVCIEVWDTGIGIPASELTAIFGEYHQLDNHARERSRGLGLGLSIVQRLSTLLDLKVHVRSVVGKGSVFIIDVARVPAGTKADDTEPAPAQTSPPDSGLRRTGRILVIEDDPEILALLEFVLTEDGHQVIAVSGSVAARDMVARRAMRPDLILADFNLPGEIDGLRLAAKLRRKLNQRVPVIILTGDISAETLREVARHDCVQLNKPVTPLQLTATIQLLLPAQTASPDHRGMPIAEASDLVAAPTIFVVDDDPRICESIRRVLESAGRVVEDFSAGEEFLDSYVTRRDSCLVVDAYLPGMNGIDLLERLRAAGHTLPAVMITGASDVGIAVRAMKAGASDFLEKPFSHDDLLASIDRALEQARDSTKLSAWRDAAAGHLAGLTSRQREIMARVLAGEPSKNIAADLGISQRTVENHRAAIMRKTGCASLPALARLALAAVTPAAPDAPFVQDAIALSVAR